MTTPQTVPAGQSASLAIACTCPDTGKEGDFLFVGDSHRTPGSRVSPIFPDLVQFFRWKADSGLWDNGASVSVATKTHTPSL